MSAIDDLPPLRDVIARHGLSAKKSLGQNFLLDLNLTSRIARASGDLQDAEVLEVGPGPGGLTRALLAGGAGRVVAIERDSRCLAALAEIAEQYPGRLQVVEADATEIDPLTLVSRGARVVANLPYNVGTLLLTGWLDGKDWPPWWSSLTLMFQREVAQRIVAQPGSKAYGRLSVLAQWRGRARSAFDVPPQAFTPPPKVTSSVVHLTHAEAPEGVDPKVMSRLTAAAFGQRRKMLRQTLKGVSDNVPGLLERTGIDGSRRGETLSIDEYVLLAKVLS
ncbi:MAG: 16S rRNA (adenine(1518)-N(6)/adenine(1519)-N(6))-dimethyltransferase RsmA [Pseudomonadota bacterium]